MALFIYFFLFLISNSNFVTSFHVECNYYEETEELIIDGIISNEDFENYGLKCGDHDVRTLKYVNCYLGTINLPLRKLQLSYPNLKQLYWRCEGYCVVKGTGIHVVGCDSGKRFRNHISNK